MNRKRASFALLTLIAALAAFAGLTQRGHDPARAATVTMTGVTVEQLASVGIVVTPATEPSPISADQAKAVARSDGPFSGEILDAELANCQMTQDAAPSGCWIVTSDPTGDLIVPSGTGSPEGTTPPPRPDPAVPDFEASFIDAQTGDYVTAVQAALP